MVRRPSPCAGSAPSSASTRPPSTGTSGPRTTSWRRWRSGSCERELDAIDLSGDWRENLRQLCWGGWRVYRGHPGFAESIARLPDDGDYLARIADQTLTELRRAGLSTGRRRAVLPLDGRPDRRHRVCSSAIVPRLADDDRGAELRRGLKRLPAATHPALHDIGDHLYPPVEEVFANSVELLLDAIQLRSEQAAQRHEEER